MIKLVENNSAQLTIDSLRYLAIRLNSRPATSHLAPAVTELKNELIVQNNKYIEVKEQRIGLTAEISYRDSVLDDAVMTLSQKILLETKNDRNHELYTKLFRISPSKMMASTNSKEQNQNVNLILNQLKTDSDYSKYSVDATTIEDLLNDLTDIESKRDSAYIDENKEKMAMNILKRKAQKLYNKMYPTLQLILENKTLINTFFKSVQ